MTKRSATFALWKGILLGIFVVAFTFANHYVPLIVQPLVGPLTGLALFLALSRLVDRTFDRLVAEVRGLVGVAIAALNAAAQSTSGELQQLRREVEQQNQSPGPKAAGFQVTAEVR